MDFRGKKLSVGRGREASNGDKSGESSFGKTQAAYLQALGSLEADLKIVVRQLVSAFSLSGTQF